MGGDGKMRSLHSILSVICSCLILLAMAFLMSTPAWSQGVVDPTPLADQSTTPEAADEQSLDENEGAEASSPGSFRFTLEELGYGERVLDSPYSTAEYTLRLPEGWELLSESFFRLDVSYAYNLVGAPETQALPSHFGDIIVTINGETQLVSPITEPALDDARFWIGLPLSLLNDPDRSIHRIQVTLDADSLCEVSHRASLTIHPTSLLSLDHDQFPVSPDLARYPRPFYQRAFETDQVRFVLPTQPTEMELAGALAVAAKLGDLTYGMVISETTDLDLGARLEALEADEPFHEHLIVIGSPETNDMILRFSQLEALPVPLRERQMNLVGEGPAAVAPGDILTYTLTLTNTTQRTVSSLSLVDTLPAYAHVVSCSPTCSATVEGEVSWPISSLDAGDALSFNLGIRLSEAINASAVENVVTLLDETSGPLNVNALTTTVSSTSVPEPGLKSSVSAGDGYFFSLGDRAVSENDGVVQEFVSPWDQTRAILVITGLSDASVYRASRAMSSNSRFPGVKGSFALVRDVHSLPDIPPESQPTDLVFADLGYEDKVLKGWYEQTSYQFDVPFGWRLTEDAYLDLRFSHSQLLDYSGSFLSVLFNGEPIATVALGDETSLNGGVKIGLPPSQVRRGRINEIVIQAKMHPAYVCVPAHMWLLVSSESLLRLDHTEENIHSLDLKFYPHPFVHRSDLADVLFALPPDPQPEECEDALQLAAALGSAAGGSDLAPSVALGDTLTESRLADYHIVTVGRPSRSPYLQQVNVGLPQPFQPGLDGIEQRIDNVIFRLHPDMSLGFIQLIPSPWNAERAFLAVTGTTDEGVRWAARVLDTRPWALKGDLALIRGDDIKTTDTRGLTHNGVTAAMATAVPEMTPAPAASPTSTPGVSASGQASQRSGRPAWLIPLVGLTGLAVVAIFAVAFWQRRQGRS